MSHSFFFSGDPTCPEEVIRAKRAQVEMERKMHVTLMDDDSQDEEEETEETPPQQESPASLEARSVGSLGEFAESPQDSGALANEIAPGSSVSPTAPSTARSRARRGTNIWLVSTACKRLSLTRALVGIANRTGLTEDELLELGRRSPGVRGRSTPESSEGSSTRSHAARRRSDLDERIRSLEQEPMRSTTMDFFMRMEERSRIREMEYRRERDARQEEAHKELLRMEQRREEAQQLQFQLMREQMQMQQQVFMAVLGKMAKSSTGEEQ